MPVETLVTDNDEIQSIHIGDYATVVSPTDSTDHEAQVNIYCRNVRVLQSVCMLPSWQEGRFLLLPGKLVYMLCKAVFLGAFAKL